MKSKILLNSIIYPQYNNTFGVLKIIITVCYCFVKFVFFVSTSLEKINDSVEVYFNYLNGLFIFLQLLYSLLPFCLQLHVKLLYIYKLYSQSQNIVVFLVIYLCFAIIFNVLSGKIMFRILSLLNSIMFYTDH